MRIAGLLFLQPLPDRLPAVLLSRQSAALRSQLDLGEHWRAAGTETEHAEDFLKRGSRLVVVAPIPLGLGIATDLYVATTQASHSGVLGAAVAISTLISLSALWYGIPLYIRNLQGHN
jgi:hypothetical protein